MGETLVYEKGDLIDDYKNIWNYHSDSWTLVNLGEYRHLSVFERPMERNGPTH